MLGSNALFVECIKKLQQQLRINLSFWFYNKSVEDTIKYKNCQTISLRKNRTTYKISEYSTIGKTGSNRLKTKIEELQIINQSLERDRENEKIKEDECIGSFI